MQVSFTLQCSTEDSYVRCTLMHMALDYGVISPTAGRMLNETSHNVTDHNVTNNNATNNNATNHNTSLNATNPDCATNDTTTSNVTTSTRGCREKCSIQFCSERARICSARG